MTRTRRSVRTVAVVLAVLLLVAGPSLVVSAQSTDRTGGIVTVAAGETVQGDLDATAGTVLVEGTVNGNLDATAGTVVVTGRVNGDLDATAGSVTIEGVVRGDADVTAGSLLVRDGATVAGNLDAAVGEIRLDGRVGGDARLAAERIAIGPAASVGGNLQYDAQEFSLADGAAVGGTVEQVDDVEFGPGFGAPFSAPGTPAVPRGAFTLYGLLVNLLLGAILLYALPEFSAAVAAHGTSEALRSGGYGLLVAVGTPLVLLVLAITVVGLPLSLVGLLLFAVALWGASIYGAFALGTAALSLAGRENRWGALLVGLVVFALLAFVPVVGGLLRAGVVLVGLGALVLAVRSRPGEDDVGPGAAESPEGPDEGTPAA